MCIVENCPGNASAQKGATHFDSLFFSNLQFVSRLLLPLAHVNSRIQVHLSLPMKLIAALEETDYLSASALDDRLVRLYTRCKKQVFDQQFSEKLDSADFGKLILHIVIDKAVMRQRAAASLPGA